MLPPMPELDDPPPAVAPGRAALGHAAAVAEQVLTRHMHDPDPKVSLAAA